MNTLLHRIDMICNRAVDPDPDWKISSDLAISQIKEVVTEGFLKLQRLPKQTTLTDNEVAALKLVLEDSKKLHGEDFIGVLLKVGAFRILKGDKALVDLANKFEDPLEAIFKNLDSKIKKKPPKSKKPKVSTKSKTRQK